MISGLFIAAALSISPLSKLSVTSDAAYPLFVGILSIAFSLIIIFEDMKKRPDEAAQDGDEGKVFTKDVLVIIGLMLLYGTLMYFIGYILSTLAFSILSITYLENGKFKTGLLVGFISTFLIVLVFKYGFSVILP